jgi:hypothetical protein
MFMFFSLSAHAMSFFTKDVELVGMFIDELYGMTPDDFVSDVRGEEGKEEEVKEEEVKERYEDKYVVPLSKMMAVALSSEYVEGLMNNFVMESTPSGNVMMRYNSVKRSFEYYSDNIIPNRFLDVVARKFVCAYNCASLYEVEKVERDVPTEEVPKKVTSSVFAKFKTYNQPNQPNQRTSVKRRLIANNVVRNVISSNRYTSCGKMANMLMLKKVDRKMVDKDYGMSFVEYKQLKN